ncbi:hypothetical protein C8Q78DRAFT_959516, partial [Trametes maxima]
PSAFSRGRILDEVTKHVVINDQALLVASTATFTNCLVVMRPKTTREDLPTCSMVRTNIKNKFVGYMEEL